MHPARASIRGFLLCLLWVCGVAAATDQPVLQPLKAGGVYALGEKAGWSVSMSREAAHQGPYTYSLRKNNLDVLKSGTLRTSAHSTIDVVLNEPAMLYLEITGPGKDAKPMAYGAAIAPTQLKPSVERPADFEQFWAEKIALLQQVPANPVLVKKDSGRPDVDYYVLKMDHIDGRHIYGQVAKPKHAGKFPGLVLFQWASPPYPLQREWVTDRAAEGWLVVNIEPHDVLPDQPKEYYDALPKELKEYNTIERENRDKNYFMYMYLADYRAVEYLAGRPDWNGRTLIASGTSMGGQQSFCVTGLNPKVTGMIVHVPSGADASGPLHGRASGYPFWPSDNAQVMATAPYFDTVNCAMNIKVPSLVSMGFIDTTSPPVGIFTAFNQIRGYKEAAPMIESPHNHLATPEQMEPYTRRSSEWLRDLVAGGDVAEPADKPSRRLDENSHLAHEELLKKKTAGQIDLYFLGDSITRRWGTSDEHFKPLLTNWNQNFSGWNAADFGWGADKTQHILWRLEHGELDGVNPKVIVLLAGTNNVGRLTPVDDDHARIADISNGIKAIIDLCRAKAPNATIIVTGITPRNDNMAVMPTIDAINANIEKFADGKTVRYVNINGKLADRSGRLYPGMTDPDMLHLAPSGYQIWADALKPHLTDLLGPRARTDKAPPPSRDPSTVTAF